MLYYKILLDLSLGYYTTTNNLEVMPQAEQAIAKQAPQDSHQGRRQSEQSEFHKEDYFSFISNHVLSNYILIPLSCIFIVGSTIYAHEHKISPVQSVYAHFLMQTVVQVIIMRVNGQRFHLKHQRDFKLLLLRGVLTTIHSLMISVFDYYMSITFYFTLSSSSILFCFILNYYIYRQPFTGFQIFALVTSVIGILIVINSKDLLQFYSNFDDSIDKPDFEHSSYLVHVLWGIVVIVESMGWAYAIITTGRHHSTFHQTLLISSLTGLAIASCLHMTQPTQDIQSHPLSRTAFERQPQLLLETIFFSGIPATAGAYFFTWGMYLSTNTGVSTIIAQLKVPIAYLIVALRDHHKVDLVRLLGATLILASIFGVLYRK